MTDQFQDAECILDGPPATRYAARETVVRDADDDLGRTGVDAPRKAPRTQGVADRLYHLASRDSSGRQILA
ncbi:MAG TPA: hypothetical protein VMU99_06085 [Acidimicrobiales bacterium]|nr:hypothetical protein [Acidimicrobiales bacterium]